MNSSIDQQFIEFVVKSLVNNPDAVSIERTIDEKGVLLELTVDPEDLGRVIGKRGATAQSLRTLLRALGTKNDARYNLKIVDNGEGPTARPPRDDKPVDTTAPDNTSTASDDDVTVMDDSKDDVPAESVASEDDHSDAVAKTRQELSDLDDLDI
jgi:predicted RNA-binding protein YlqC (UPF0109 family)